MCRWPSSSPGCLRTAPNCNPIENLGCTSLAWDSSHPPKMSIANLNMQPSRSQVKAHCINYLSLSLSLSWLVMLASKVHLIPVPRNTLMKLSTLMPPMTFQKLCTSEKGLCDRFRHCKIESWNNWRKDLGREKSILVKCQAATSKLLLVPI